MTHILWKNGRVVGGDADDRTVTVKYPIDPSGESLRSLQASLDAWEASEAEDANTLHWAADGLEHAQQEPLGPHDEVDRAKIARIRDLANRVHELWCRHGVRFAFPCARCDDGLVLPDSICKICNGEHNEARHNYQAAQAGRVWRTCPSCQHPQSRHGMDHCGFCGADEPERGYYTISTD